MYIYADTPLGPGMYRSHITCHRHHQQCQGVTHDATSILTKACTFLTILRGGDDGGGDNNATPTPVTISTAIAVTIPLPTIPTNTTASKDV